MFLSMNGEVNVFPSRGGETGPRKEERSGWYISRVDALWVMSLESGHLTLATRHEPEPLVSF